MNEKCDISKGAQNPWTGTIGGITGLLLCLYLACQWGTPGWWGSSFNRTTLLWFIPAVIFLIMGVIDQCLLKGFWETTESKPLYHSRFSALARSAWWRFLALGLLLTILRCLYFNHPLYTEDFYSSFRGLFVYLYKGYWVLGFPYILATLYWRGGDENRDERSWPPYPYLDSSRFP